MVDLYQILLTSILDALFLVVFVVYAHYALGERSDQLWPAEFTVVVSTPALRLTDLHCKRLTSDRHMRECHWHLKYNVNNVA